MIAREMKSSNYNSILPFYLTIYKFYMKHRINITIYIFFVRINIEMFITIILGIILFIINKKT